MTNILIKLFVKDSNDTKNSTVRKHYGIFASTVGVITNVFLSLIKLIAGFLSGSIAIVADAVNNLSDAGSSIISLLGFKISSKPRDRDHPFGHARMEYISSMIVSILILIVGFELFSESIKNIISGELPPEFNYVTFIILSCSIILKLWLGFFYRKIGKRINSSTMKATATDSFTDVISTAAVLISSIIVKYTNLQFIDSAVGIVVSIIIFIAGIKILNENRSSLLGEAPVKETVDSIYAIADKYTDILGIHDMIVHNYGPEHYIASFHAEVDGSKNIFEIHDSIDALEREIQKTLGIICTIHMDPIDLNDELSKELKEKVRECAKRVSTFADIHDFRTVKTSARTTIIFDVLVPYEESLTDDEISTNISKEVSKIDSTYETVITVDRA